MVSVLVLCPNLGSGQNLNTLVSPRQASPLGPASLSVKDRYQHIRQGLQGNDPSIKLQKLKRDNQNLNLKRNASGGVDSGGGTFVRKGSCLVLLDLYLHNRIGFCGGSKAASILPETKAYNEMGFDRLISNEIPLVQKALNQVQKWAPSSPVMAPRIAQALKRLPIYYTSFHIRAEHQNYHLPAHANIAAESLVLGAYYLKGFGVFVEKNTLDQVSEENQIALLVHESLRHLQISLETGMSNEVVQKLTAQIMRAPKTRETLDTNEFMQGPILDTILEKQETALFAYETLNSACRAGLTRYCDLMLMPGPFGEEFLEALGQALELRVNQPILELRDFKRENPEHLVSSLQMTLLTWGLGDTLARTDESLFTLGRVSSFYSLLDTALHDFNTQNVFFSKEGRTSARILEDVREQLKQNGFFY